MRTNPSTYFEDIGAWPKGSRAIGTAYLTGFLLSLICTAGAYFLATRHLLSGVEAMVALSLFACLQCFVQIVCFFHLGAEAASRSRLVMLAWAALLIFILVSGSIWIMRSLNDRMMPDTGAMMRYMDAQTGI
jgi:cytochrome o ubiquinol oxidase operon protein cyoD